MPKQSTNILSRGRNRRNLDRSNHPAGANAVATLNESSMESISLNLSVPCSLTGIPQYLTTGVNGGLPISATMNSPTLITLVYAATQAASSNLNIPVNDPALRTYSGGYVDPADIDPNP
jgi:hypothetical protein